MAMVPPSRSVEGQLFLSIYTMSKIVRTLYEQYAAAVKRNLHVERMRTLADHRFAR
jgi:hypothetical protein